VREFWGKWFGISVPPVEDIYRGLIDRFLGEVHVAQPEELARARNGGVLFLANHQTAMESTLFALVGSALMGAPVLTLAKSENEKHWLHRLMRHYFSYPGLRDPAMTQHFVRSDPASLPGIISRMGADMAATGRSLLVHVEGTRSLSCRVPVQKLSGTFIELAVEQRRPIVPVRFYGGLPVAPLDQRAELPVGMGKQDIYLGALLTPESLGPLTYGARREKVLEALNGTGPAWEEEVPFPPDSAFDDSVRTWMTERGVDLGHATIFRSLEALPDASAETAQLLRGVLDPARPLPMTTPEERWLGELVRRLGGETRVPRRA
jgi:1-acyl-sn-glycerol-3-phosphate acyltransferase